MITKKELDLVLNTHSVETIEQHLIWLYVKQHNLDVTASLILEKYLSSYSEELTLNNIFKNSAMKNISSLESSLELIIPKNDRSINGAFFTPAYVVNYIINEVQPAEKDKCLDPSCGCGAFLVGLVKFYQRKYNKGIKETVATNIYGSDILSYNVRRTKLILSIYALQNGEVLEDKDFNVYHQDSLRAVWGEKFEVVVGNPPYVKYQDLTNENRNYLASNWQSIENGTFNLYFAFFELGYSLLSKSGRLGYITPNNYFTSLAGLSLRKYFSNKKCLTKVLDFRHKKVFDAQTYTAISFLNKRKNTTIMFDKIKDYQTCHEFLTSAKGSPNLIDNLNVKKWRLLTTKEQKNIKIIETIGTPISQLFNISVGIATLKDEVFFVDSKNEKNGFLTKKTANGTFLIEKEITKPVYKISNFQDQEDIDNNTLRIITPYKTAAKNATPILEQEFKAKYPKCYEFLLSEQKRLAARDKGKKEFEPFYIWGRTQGISRVGIKILNPTFSKHPRFLIVSDKDAYYTNGYGIYFNKDTTLFGTLEHTMSKEENISLVQKILNSTIMDYYVTATSVSIQGGFPCYQKNFIERFTIPEFTSKEVSILKSLSEKEKIDAFLIEKYQLNIPVPNLVS